MPNHVEPVLCGQIIVFVDQGRILVPTHERHACNQNEQVSVHRLLYAVRFTWTEVSHQCHPGWCSHAAGYEQSLRRHTDRLASGSCCSTKSLGCSRTAGTSANSSGRKCCLGRKTHPCPASCQGQRPYSCDHQSQWSPGTKLGAGEQSLQSWSTSFY